MYITIVSAECAPVAKVGGLGDFVHGLARELALQGEEVELILPKYDNLRFGQIEGLTPVYRDLMVPYFEQWLRCSVEAGIVDGIRCLFISAHAPQRFFERGRIYGEPDDIDRFAFFSRAVMEYLFKSGRHPDIIHCHDWHTGLIPVLLFDMYQALGMTRPRVCYTLHNLGHQGIAGEYVLHQVGLNPTRLMTGDRLLDPRNPHAVNLMKGGIVFSNFVTTVSPRYAWEIQNTDQGMGMQDTLRIHDRKFGGVLNGIDYDTWSPETDQHLAQTYSIDRLPLKARNKSALRQRFGMAEADKPMISVISRLDYQKGVDLIRHTVRWAQENECQLVLLGSAQDPKIDADFQELKRETDGSPDCHLELGYDDALSHQIYAAADLMVIPSVYEPCGLTQMIAMKYGVVPVVRRVGGLADTVFDANFCDKPFERRNGYVFDELSPEGLESALRRAVGLWFEHPEYFRQLRINGMRMDNSWTRPSRQYLDIYRHVKV